MRAGIRSRPWAGLDIGSYSIKLLATAGGAANARYWLAETALPVPLNGSDATLEATEISRVIGSCLERAQLSPRALQGVSLGIAGPDVIIKQISLPLMDDDEVGSALRFEARKHLPFDPEAMIIDYQILSRSSSHKKLDILLAAVSNDHVERHLEPLRMLGLSPDIVDAAPLALTNALVHHADIETEGHMLLDIGHTSSHLTLIQRGAPYFSRRIDFGGRRLTEAIMRDTSIPFAEAEEFKLAAGSDTPGFVVNWELPEMQAILRCLQQDLGEELRRSLAFYRTLGPLPEQLNLWISGGSARLPGLAAQLTEMLGFPVLLFNPLDFLTGEPRGGNRPALGPQFAQVFGLALRSA